MSVSVSVSVRDKAGGYGIQALGGMLVEYVHGDFLNVVGFPLNHFCKQLDAVFNSSGLALSEEILSLSEKNVNTHTSRSCQSDLNLAAATSPKPSAKHDPSSNSYSSQTHCPAVGPVLTVGSLTL